VKIEKTEIGGMPIKQVRDVLRRLRGGHRGDFIGTRQQIAERAGRDITDALVADGLLEPYAPSSDAKKDEEERIIPRRYSSGGPYYRITRRPPTDVREYAQTYRSRTRQPIRSRVIRSR